MADLHQEVANPSAYGAKPVHGNYTEAASIHLWCAHALACVLASPGDPIESLNDDLQKAIRHLLLCEVARAKCAQEAGHG